MGAVNYAKLGGRPTVAADVAATAVEDLIEKCWSESPDWRPSFQRVLEMVEDEEFVIPDGKLRPWFVWYSSAIEHIARRRK